MGEEVRMTEYDGGYGGGADHDRVFEWEDGLPNVDDLTPLCQMLISSELASAFRITPEPSRSMLDVNRASENTMTSLRDSGCGGGGGSGSGSGSGQLPDFSAVENENDLPLECSDSRKMRKIAEDEAGFEEADDDSSNATKTVKRARLVWTPQLHKRFIEVVARLGIKNAVPKTIMQFMNVEGLTRENVASHLQKYRLYLKRQHDGPGQSSSPPPPSSDHMFSSAPQAPQSLHQSGGGHGQHQTSNGHFAMQYPQPHMMPMQMMGMGMAGHGGYHGYDMMQQRDWSGNNLGSYHHLARNDKCQ